MLKTFLCALIVSIATLGHTSDANDAELKAKATMLAKKFLIVDGHVDIPYRLQRRDADISKRTDHGDFDYERAKAGGLDAPFMSIYIPASYQAGGAKDFADNLIDLVESFEKRWGGKFKVAHNTAEVEATFKAGKIALPLGMENGAPIEGSMENLKHFYDRGIRYITLTHSKNNHICDSSYDAERKWYGLSPFGKKLIPEMNKLGIMIDISHISDDTFYQVMELTEVPVIASHSSCRHFTPNFERNMNDPMIKRLAKNGGVIMINFGSTFISHEVRSNSDKLRPMIRKYAEEHDLSWGDEKLTAYAKKIGEGYKRYADIEEVVDHIDHVVKLVGVDYVGLGSDFDGVGDSLPTGLKDASMYPNLIYHLLKRGYSEADIEKICSGNAMRVWKAVEAYAAKH